MQNDYSDQKQAPSSQFDAPARLGTHTRYTYNHKTVTRSDDTIGLAVLHSTTSIIGSASWPLAAVAIACLFKADLSKLMGRLKEFSGLGIHANLDSFIQSSLPPASISITSQTNTDSNSDVLLTKTHNTLDAIITSWLRVEVAINKFLDLDPIIAQNTPLKSKIEKIKSDLNLNTSLKNLIIELSIIRNRVARSKEEVSADSINLFVANADKAAGELLTSIKPV